MNTTDRTAEAQAYAAADAAIAKADALTFGAVFGRAQTEAEFVNQYVADMEAAEACRKAAKFGPESFRKQYAAHAAFFAAMTA
jgi:hypothetical protein